MVDVVDNNSHVIGRRGLPGDRLKIDLFRIRRQYSDQTIRPIQIIRKKQSRMIGGGGYDYHKIIRPAPLSDIQTRLFDIIALKDRGAARRRMLRRHGIAARPA